ncbi:hypothetical protein FACS1894190_12620 [Spirochaetia bacterium]|nr:hypothetical protein FACS1894190_12620 [Spirochaetia bacterium]
MCFEIIVIITKIITAIGALLTGIGAVANLPKLLTNAFMKDECLWGDEAKNRYERIKDTLPTKQPFAWGPVEWQGGKDFKFMLEIKKISYNSETMGAEWKGCKKSVLYVYPEGEKLMAKGWRFK